jgi:hypothetical protein
MDIYSFVLMTAIIVLAVITVIALRVSYTNLIVKKPAQWRKGIIAILVALGCIYNIFDLLNRYK